MTSDTSTAVQRRRPQRTDGYLPIRDYAAIGDRHTVALVGLDGSVDWLCLPGFDGPFVLGALVDSDRGGRFALAPTDDYEVSRRYVPETNVLETTFHTASGCARVTDALTIPLDGRPVRELARRIEGLHGQVRLAWRVAPRFAHTHRPALIESHPDGVVAARDGDAVVVQAWAAGEPWIDGDAVCGRVTIESGTPALLALSAISIADGPLPFPARGEIEARLDATIVWWRERWRAATYDGPWREAVLRSGLVLEMLVDADTHAIAAAATTGLPETIGGSRNWDYRFCWLRDSSFAVDALMQLGDDQEAGRFLAWAMEASREHHPRLHPFYRLDGSPAISQQSLDLAGYRGSRPVLEGNGAVDQRQLGNYGDLLQSATLYADRGHGFDDDVAQRLAGIADYVCEAWTERDSGIWELGTRLHYTASKMQCWIALDRAMKLAAAGKIPGENSPRWRESARRIHDFVEERCWSKTLGAYARSADSDELDAGVLVGIFMDYEPSDRQRLHATVDRLREQLGAGPLLYRYTGMPNTEGTFLACAFWTAHALARLQRVPEASTLMDELVGLANDVGLYSEEMGADGHEMLGNFPQALTHLALINAAAAIDHARR
ncbi:MAG: glycoside hydrolase family 15 protein [Solirubrobacterales bacterium]|nr:MAG: glycoside hydrolase family 15 protein [Solirubrobacterales bacterium]